MPETNSTQNASPTLNASSPAASTPSPRCWIALWMCGSVSIHIPPLEAPSNVVVPITVHSSATVPGHVGRSGRPESGGRSRSSRPRRSTTESRPHSPNQVPKASARSLHVSSPNRLMPTICTNA